MRRSPLVYGGICQRFTIVALILITAARVEAQPSLTPPTGEADLRNPGHARALSLFVPALTMGASLAILNSDEDAASLGVPLFLAGAIVGPSTGLWYAGHPGGKGMLARAASGGLVAAGIASFISGSTHDGCSSDACRRSDDRAEQMAVVFTTAGLAGFAASWFYDAREAGRIVQRKNRAVNATLVPAVLPAAGGTRAPGAMLTGTF